ncbi:MAG: hypothetical protein ACOH14_06360 [Rhodoglobus sp.]
MADYIGPNGQGFSTDSIRARMSRAAQVAADRIIAQHDECGAPEASEVQPD